MVNGEVLEIIYVFLILTEVVLAGKHSGAVIETKTKLKGKIRK